jgi:hypothetical protein
MAKFDLDPTFKEKLDLSITNLPGTIKMRKIPLKVDQKCHTKKQNLTWINLFWIVIQEKIYVAVGGHPGY